MKNSSINQKKINEIVDDEVIIKQFFERDERAIVNIEQKYGKYCYSIAFRILLNEKDTEEYNFCNRNFKCFFTICFSVNYSSVLQFD